ncbi:hypothetical protein BDN70DRAFT_653456 [Pholiota conissans]|uniref:Protein kinase domain-containing protein n=1 Tax=Pholiota conissans TaxID=109636 RepID=A0A9P5YN01_9AGAR|nr:hypothetical protein BDN70DRAFT_653456 [Pholiota conissans]
MTVKVPTAEEILEARLHLDGPKECTPDDNFVKFEVIDDATVNARTRHFIAKCVFKQNSSLLGRASYGYVVWNPVKKAVVFMKDTWRVSLPGIDKEGNIYREMHAAGVENIAPLECAGDVEHAPVVQDFMIAAWARWKEKKVLRRYVHYRIVLGVIGRDLTKFRSAKELVTAIHDATVAHDQILKAGIIHRDISVGNILILDNGRGILIGFDLCKRLKDLKETARDSDRSGTWQFMSARLQSSHTPLHPERADDLESLLHVLTWVALKYVPNGLSPARLTDILTGVFDFSSADDSGYVSGLGRKSQFLCARTISECGSQHTALLMLMIDLTNMCASRYEHLAKEHGTTLKDFRTAKKRRRLLGSSDWFIKRFAKALEMPGWPIDDGPVDNPMVPEMEKFRYVSSARTQRSACSSCGVVRSSVKREDTTDEIGDDRDSDDDSDDDDSKDDAMGVNSSVMPRSLHHCPQQTGVAIL